jgi:hypothetical protein
MDTSATSAQNSIVSLGGKGFLPITVPVVWLRWTGNFATLSSNAQESCVAFRRSKSRPNLLHPGHRRQIIVAHMSLQLGEHVDCVQL